MSNEIVKVETDSGTVELSGDIIRRTLCNNPKVTDREVELFIGLCKAQHLNPFIKEAHLVKYGDKPATMIVGKDVFTKRAQKNPRFKGLQAGISFNSGGKLGRREGSMLLPGEEILGGWCKVYVEGYQEPMYDEVAFSEYVGRKSDGAPNQQWSSKPGTMIRKVAVVHALREAFPDDFAGLYDEAEMGVDIQAEPPSKQPTEIKPEAVEDVPDVWQELSELKQAAISLGVKEEGIDSWMAAHIKAQDGSPKKRKDYTEGDITLLRTYLQDLVRDASEQLSDPVEVEAEIIDSGNAEDHFGVDDDPIFSIYEEDLI